MKKTIVMFACAILVACGGKQQPPVAQQPAQPKTSLPAAIQQALPPSTPAAPAVVAQPQAAATPDIVTGKILETMNSGGYTYVRIATPAGDRWAAVRETKVKKGANVSVAVQMIADNFESKTLSRKFDHIIFGAIAEGAAPAVTPATPTPATAMASAMGTPSDHMRAAADTGNISVEKAEGGKSVAEIWAEKAALQDKPVTIRGKVVKFLPEILGKNWVHLHDGSGSREKGDDDLTVTTTEAVKVGEVVTFTGTLRVDKDFGAGYRYPVIIEDAKLKKQ